MQRPAFFGTCVVHQSISQLSLQEGAMATRVTTLHNHKVCIPCMQIFNKLTGTWWPAVSIVPPIVGAGHRLVEPTELRIQTAIHVSKRDKENLPLKHENSSVIERTKMTQQHGGVGMLATLLRPERTPHIVCGDNADVQMGSSQFSQTEKW